jgi:hypothetical protein
MSSGTIEGLDGVWGSNGSDVFAVGSNGTILHYDGTAWSPMSNGTTERLRGVWGSGASDIFAVGDDGTIMHYDGVTWSAMSSGTTVGLNAVWGSSGSEVFAVGGTILHYDGTSWSVMSSPTAPYPSDVWGSCGSDVFAVGGSGAILHYSCQAAPVALDDYYTTTEDIPLAVAAPGVLANDSDPEGDPLAAVLDSPPLSGTLALNLDGSFTYTPALSFAGVDAFTYHATDAISASNVATVTLTVEPQTCHSVYLPLVLKNG